MSKAAYCFNSLGGFTGAKVPIDFVSSQTLADPHTLPRPLQIEPSRQTHLCGMNVYPFGPGQRPGV